MHCFPCKEFPFCLRPTPNEILCVYNDNGRLLFQFGLLAIIVLELFTASGHILLREIRLACERKNTIPRDHESVNGGETTMIKANRVERSW